MEYHRRATGERGCALAGTIVQQKFLMLDGLGKPKELFGGELYLPPPLCIATTTR
jgi:hypothetical protein